MNGKELKQDGINQSAENAEFNHPGWAEEALSFVVGMAVKHFMTEDVRMIAYKNGLPRPPHERAWGGVIQGAVKKGLIKQVAYGKVKNPRAHQANAAVWEKC